MARRTRTCTMQIIFPKEIFDGYPTPKPINEEKTAREFAHEQFSEMKRSNTYSHTGPDVYSIALSIARKSLRA